MKNAKCVSASAFLFFFFFTSCTRDTTGLSPSTDQVLVRSIWIVDYYFNNQDMTNSFSSARLLFSGTGAVGFQKNGETIAGTWSKATDASKNELISLHFNTKDADVTRLNGSWILTNLSDNSLQFQETGGTDILFRLKAQ